MSNINQFKAFLALLSFVFCIDASAQNTREAKTDSPIYLAKKTNVLQKSDSSFLHSKHALKNTNLVTPHGKSLWSMSQKNSLKHTLNKSALVLLDSLKHLNPKTNQTEMAKLFNQLGQVYNEMGDLEKSKKYRILALKIFEKIKDYDNMVMSFCGVAEVYLNQDKLDSSIYYFDKAVANKHKIVKHHDLLLRAYSGRCCAHMFNNEPDKGLEDLRLAKEVAIKYGTLADRIDVAHRLADAMYLTKAYQKCIDVTYLTHDSFSTSYTLQDWYQHYEHLAWSFKDLNETDSAIKYFLVFQQYSDSLKIQTNRDKTAEAFAKFEVELYEKQSKLYNQIAISQKNQKRFFVTLSLISIVAIILILFAFKKYRKQKELTIKTQREAAERTIAHTQEILASQTNLIIEKNRIIDELNASVSEFFDSTMEKNSLLENMIDKKILTKEDWLKFKRYFDVVHPTFIIKLKERFNGITESEIRLLCLIKIGMSNNEIGNMLGILHKSVTKTISRFRSRFNLDANLSMEKLIEQF